MINKMSIENSDKSMIKSLAISFATIYILAGILGIIFLFTLDDLPILIDPIQQMILILNGIIFLRGYINLYHNNKSGEAFLFVGTIIGIIIGSIAFLNFLFGGVLGGFINERSLVNFIDHIYFYLFNPSLILGFLTFIPHKIIKQNEAKWN